MDQETMAQLYTWAPILLMVVIFYFLLYRPQKKAQKKRQEMLSALKKGAKVVTIGGIYGKITDINEKSVKLEIANGVTIEMSRQGVSNVVTDED